MLEFLGNLRKYRIGRFAIFDFIISFIVFYLLFGIDGVLIAVPVGILVHRLCGVETPLNRILGL